MINAIDDYLTSLNRRLFWMDHRRRQDVIKEVRSHLLERADSGEDSQDVIAAFGTPAEVARSYMRVYGFGVTFLSILVVFGALLAFFTVPAIYQRTDDLLEVTWTSLGFLAVAIILIIVTSLKGGKRAGVVVGASECGVRFIVLGMMLLEGSATFVDGIIGPLGFIATSLMLPVIGFLSNAFSPTHEHPEI